MRTYHTSEIAAAFGLHPNTIRLYEAVGFLPKVPRMKNGYRIFTDLHMEQMKVIRLALKGEVLQNGLRKEAIEIIKTSAQENYNEAIAMAEHYLQRIREEKEFAEDAIGIAENIMNQSDEDGKILLTRKQAADSLHVTIDTLRNWELNGLLTVKRKENGYRVYNWEDIRLLKIIRCLRSANYSLTAILRMLNDRSRSSDAGIKQSIDTPKGTEDIVSVCDRLLTSLLNTGKDAEQLLLELQSMKQKFNNPPL